MTKKSLENLLILFKRGKDLLSNEPRLISLLIRGYYGRKEFAPWVSKFSPLRVTPNFQVIQLALLKKRVKLTFGSVKRVWKTVNSQGKIREF